MRKLFLAAAVACLAIFASCEKQETEEPAPEEVVEEQSGNLYGIWALDSKTEGSNTVDYSSFHFYLVLSDVGIPHAVVKKGSLSALDLDDVDVDATRIIYDEEKKQIDFLETIWLSEKLIYNMRLSGTFDILELSDTKLSISQVFLGTKTVFTYHREKKNES